MGERNGDLEVLAPLADEPLRERPDAAVATRGRRPRWPVVAVLVAVTSLAVVFPVRDRIARGQLRWLERQWAQALADDNERISAEHRLTAYTVVVDSEAGVAPINAGIAGVYEEERGRFDRLRVGLHHAVLVDQRITAIRADMAATLAHWAALLAGVALWYRNPTDASAPPSVDDQVATGTGRVVAAIGAARAHWSERAPSPSAPAAPYASAAASLARLSRWLDQPTGTVLIATSGNRPARLDVDASRVTPLDAAPDSGSLVMRQGYLAYLSGGQAWAIAPEGSSPPRALAPAAWLFAADDPAAIWVVDGSTFAATEVDGNGRVLAGPVSPDGTAQAAAAGVLVESPPEGTGLQPSDVELWSLAGHQVLCRLGVAGSTSGTVATHGRLVAWFDGANALHVTDVASCADQLNLPIATDPQDPHGHFLVATFSPDGKTLAVATGHADLPGLGDYPLRLVDVRTGTVKMVSTHAYLPLESVVWTADSTRLFWLYGGRGSPTLLGTWKVGDQQSYTLRAVNLDLGPPLLAVP